jgi:hypothetical protein
METRDDDYSTETESELSFGAVDFDQIVQEAEARRVSSRLHTIVLMDKHITKCLYGQDYEYDTSLRVIGATLRMQKGHLQKVPKLGKKERDTVCDLFHIDHDAYSQIVGGYLHN